MSSRIPPELLDKIFAELQCQPSGNPALDNFDEDDVKPDRLRSGDEWLRIQQKSGRARLGLFRRQHCLTPLLTVCRHWRDLAERRLYHSISIDERGQPMARVLSKLSRTLASNSHIAGLVRELRIYTDTSTPQSHAQTITQCRRLTHLTLIFPYFWTSLREQEILLEAARGLAGLQSLVFLRQGDPTTYRTSDVQVFKNPYSARSADALIQWVQIWPEGEYMAFLNSDSELPLSDLGPPTSPIQTARCLRLRSFYTDVTLYARHLCALATLAPALTSLDFWLDIDCPENATVLHDALRTWAPRLENLSIRMHPRVDMDSDFELDASLCQELAGVKSLRATSSLIPPTSLTHFANTTILSYTLASAADSTHLCNAIAAMKSLKLLSIAYDTHALDGRRWAVPPCLEIVRMLRPVCAARGITLSQAEAPHNDDSDESDGHDGHDDHDGYDDNDDDDGGRWSPYDSMSRMGRDVGSGAFFVDGDWYFEDSDEEPEWY